MHNALEPVWVRAACRRNSVSDAGDTTSRADLAPEDGMPVHHEPEHPPGGLSKRAARRRRKRRAALAAGGAEQSERSPAQSKIAKSPEKSGDGKPPRRGRGQDRREPKRAPPAEAMRGVRHSHPPGDPAKARARDGDRRRGPDRCVDPALEPPPRTGGNPIPGQNGTPAPALIAPRSRRIANGPLYAALDLGTNNCRLLVAEPQERGFRVVDAFSRIVRLGEGIGRSGRLSEAAMDRAVDALAVCGHKMAELNVRRMRLVATEACRAAENGQIFLDRVHAETGLALEIVDRETEARLAVAGCATLVDARAEGVLLFDIGGGSSELVWLDLRERGEARGFALTRFIKAWTSLPVGVVTLSERHGGVSVTPDVFEAMVGEVSDMLADFRDMDEVGPLIAEGRVHMLGTSGTVTTLAGIHLGLKRYDRRRVDGVWLDAADVDLIVNRLVTMGFDERVANPCIGSDRADLVLAGCAILEAIRQRWPCEKLRVADRGLREGILVELMARDGVWRRRNRPQA